jgi:hypothetical protein
MATSVQEDQDSLLQWTQQMDTLLATWCDQAKCFEFMHNETYALYNNKARKFMITITILSALTGTSNIIAGGVSIGGFQASWFFGGLTVITSIGTILQDKLGYQQSADSNLHYCATWGQIRRKIERELILPYNSRKECGSFLKMIRSDIDQVSNDGASKIPKTIREACLAKFQNIADFDVPDICGHMEHTKVYQQQHTQPLLAAANIV